MIPKPLLRLIPVLLYASTYGQQPSLIPGTTLVYRFHTIIKSKTETYPGRSVTWRFEVMPKDDSGSARVRCTLVGFGNTSADYPCNSNDLTTARLNGSDDLANLILLYHPIECTLDARGNVIKNKGLTEIISQKAGEWALKPDIKALLMDNAGSFMNQEMQEVFPFLPTGTTPWPDNWLNADSSRKYTVQSKEGPLWQIHYVNNERPRDTASDFTSQFDGLLQWDPGTKRMISSTQKSAWSGTAKDPSGHTFSYQLAQTMDVQLLPDTFRTTAVQDDWCNVLVRMNFWSTALRDGPEYDPARVNAFFKKYDSVYGHYKSYVLQKLLIIQSSRTTGHFDKYSEALAHVPNAWLAGEYSHLHNKLQNAYTENADSAYELAKYLSKDFTMYSEWVQFSFAQAFTGKKPVDSGSEQEQRRRQVGVALLDRLSHDPDTVLRNATYPLWLWSEAKQHSSDTALLHRNTALLEELSPTAGKQGNADRYALLLYKQLQATGEADRAAELLNHTIARLETEANDSTNKERWLAANMLAYAWAEQYERTKATDPKAAMNYLSKAAAYSPKNPSELAHGSFYDRVLLHSKESYRSAFANALIAAGDEKQALTVLGEQMRLDPTILGEVKKAFTTHFPDRDFNTFFAGVLVRSWKMAPDFTLTGIDGHTYRLADYKGKWLLLDFWGTWCGPCREEMPDNNAFVKSIRQRPDMAFLSIACQDNPADVKSYIATNHFEMPVLLSDDKVQKEYEIAYYPSKFIISPDGRILPLRSGADWKKIMEQFSALSKEKARNLPGDGATLKNKKD